ncbi:hypothetical protein S101258_00499 [Lactiplantibacillus plantarum subsp. plantarum]|uniref:Uncharacterized protein n=1 Tax=Lactiplantibacillus plantarum subsp. plantarum TaxID=337330 RepID=A0A2S3U972_LACPN|nr:hypothetical protein S101258_00499 [Lactiplantibacillus plantarum subsp. plantarum]
MPSIKTVGTMANITDYVLIPAGFSIAAKNADGTYSVSDDPTATLTSDIETMLVITTSLLPD